MFLSWRQYFLLNDSPFISKSPQSPQRFAANKNLLSFSGHISSYGLVVDLWSEMGRYYFKSILPSMVPKSNCRIFFFFFVSTKFSMWANCNVSPWITEAIWKGYEADSRVPSCFCSRKVTTPAWSLHCLLQWSVFTVVPFPMVLVLPRLGLEGVYLSASEPFWWPGGFY